MTMWIIIMWVAISFVITALFYLSDRVPSLFDFENVAQWSRFKQFSLGLLITLGFTGIVALCIDFINAMVCVLYLAMIWAVSDCAFWMLEKFWHIHFEHYYAGRTALVISAAALMILNHRIRYFCCQTIYTKSLFNFNILQFVGISKSIFKNTQPRTYKTRN